MAAPSQAQQFIERFKQRNAVERVAELKSFIGSNPPTFETHWLEFKGATDRGNPLDADTIKKHWGKALSAFANTDGGVLIWGIDAREDRATRVDAACGLALAPNAAALTSRLQELQPTITDPPVTGGEVVCVPDGNGPAGFVVCFVPRSIHRPHRSEPHQQYYIRVEGNSVIPVPSLLRSMFYPQSQPRFQIYLRPTYERGTGLSGSVTVQAWLHNNGSATADDVCVLMMNPREHGFDGRCWSNVKSGWPGELYAARRPIHPGEMYDLFTLTLDFSLRASDRVWFLATQFSIRVFARNQGPMESKFTIPNEVFGQNFAPPMTEVVI